MISRTPLLLALVIAYSGCATLPQSDEPNLDRARRLSMDYLARHHAPLPRGYTIDVKKSEFIPELQPLRTIYVTEIYVPRHGKRVLRYTFTVDPGSWVVEDFNDYRTGTPLH